MPFDGGQGATHLTRKAILMEPDAEFFTQLSTDADNLEASLVALFKRQEFTMHCHATTSKELAAFAKSKDKSDQDWVCLVRNQLESLTNQSRDLNNEILANLSKLSSIRDAAVNLEEYNRDDFPMLETAKWGSSKRSNRQTVNDISSELMRVAIWARREAARRTLAIATLRKIAEVAICCQNAASRFITDAKSKVDGLTTDNSNAFHAWVQAEIEGTIESAITAFLKAAGDGEEIDLILDNCRGNYRVGKSCAHTASEACWLWCELIRKAYRAANARIVANDGRDCLPELKNFVDSITIPDLSTDIQREVHATIWALAPNQLPTISGSINQSNKTEAEIATHTDHKVIADDDSAQDQHLKEAEAAILQTLYEQKAFATDDKMKLEQICDKAFGKHFPHENYKKQAGNLVKHGFAKSIASRDGGYWLTSSGIRRAEVLIKAAERNAP